MRASEASGATRWVLLLALSAATALIYIVSLRGNYLYGYGLGQTPEKRELFAWANVAADIWKGFGLVAVLLLWRAHKRTALIALLAWAISLATGVNSAIGVYVQDRVSLTGMRDAKYRSYKDVERELARVEERLASLAYHRNVSQVDAAITAVLARPVIINDRVRGTVGSLSNNCTRADPRTAQSCAEVGSLKEELAAAHEASRHEIEAKRLRGLVRELRDQGGSLAPDPVGEFWAWATRGLLSVQDVGFGFPLLFALLIETVSALGPAVIVAIGAATRSHQTVMQPAAAGFSRVEHAASFLDSGSLVHWLADRTEPTSNPAGVTIEALFTDYASWCAGIDVFARAPEPFADEFNRVRNFPELASSIRKAGDRYYGLRLVRASRVPQLTSANDA